MDEEEIDPEESEAAYADEMREDGYPNMEAPTNREYRDERLRRVLSCSLCPPHRGDNHGRVGSHGARQRLYKMRRKGRA